MKLLVIFLLASLICSVYADFAWEVYDALCGKTAALVGDETGISCLVSKGLIKLYSNSLKGSYSKTIIKKGTCSSIQINPEDFYEICTSDDSLLYIDPDDVNVHHYVMWGNTRCYAVRRNCSRSMPGVPCTYANVKFCAGIKSGYTNKDDRPRKEGWSSCILNGQMYNYECSKTTTPFQRCMTLYNRIQTTCSKDYKF